MPVTVKTKKIPIKQQMETIVFVGRVIFIVIPWPETDRST